MRRLPGAERAEAVALVDLQDCDELAREEACLARRAWRGRRGSGDYGRATSVGVGARAEAKTIGVVERGTGEMRS